MLYLNKRVNKEEGIKLGSKDSAVRALKGIPRIRKIPDGSYPTQRVPGAGHTAPVAITFKERISVGSPIHNWTY